MTLYALYVETITWNISQNTIKHKLLKKRDNPREIYFEIFFVFNCVLNMQKCYTVKKFIDLNFFIIYFDCVLF